MNFITQLLNGLGLGSIYALVALGYSMVYGIVQLINFAHGDIIMVGGYMVYLAMATAGLPIWLALPFSILVCALAGLIIQRVAYRRLLVHNAARISLLITALGVSIFLQNLFMLLFTPDPKTMPTLFGARPVDFGGITLTSDTLINIVVSVLLMVGLQLLVRKTKIGKAMQATSEDTGAAKLMGINTNSVVAFTFDSRVDVPSLMAVCTMLGYRSRLRLSAGEPPRLQLHLSPGEDALAAAGKLTEELRLKKEELGKAHEGGAT